ncbi:FOXH [Mytilus coruscus]|uniref:FOXH n=1 Tax=Mytilus coruscus TaxID=42192 RepID=A0A6J8CR07_MYTCO|nr:FOXH [Mytilus coruscus]
MLRQDIPTLSLLPPVSPFSESSNSSTDELIRVASQRAMASQHQDTSMVSDGSQSDNSDISATTVSTTQSIESVKSNQTSATTKPSYQRHPKPPYSYLGMIIMAIEMSPDKALSLSEIHLSLVSMFPFFRGTYRGWKDSVRHTLSSGACFFKCLRGRINKWAVHLHLAPYNALLRQDTAVSRSTYWPPTIYDYLGVPEIMFPTKYNTVSPSATTSDNILETKRPTDFSIDRILTPEIADDSRPLLTDDTSPKINKMTLKLKTRKTTTRRHQSSPLTKLVIDSATKWGVTEETAVDQLRSLCKIMDTTSALQQHQASEQLQFVKSEIPSPSPTDTSNHSHPSELQESSSNRYQLPSASVPSYFMTSPSFDYQSQAYQQNVPFSTAQSYNASQHHQLYTTEYLQQLYAAHQYQQQYAHQQQLYTQLYHQQQAAQQYVYHPSFQGYQQNGFFQVPADFNTLAVDVSSPSCQ